MHELDRIGQFQVRPHTWRIARATKSQAVGIGFTFIVLAEWSGDDWESWEAYETTMVEGVWWIIKRDGSVNSLAVGQLSESLGWTVNLEEVAECEPPAKNVRVTVTLDEYKGDAQYRADWMRPVDDDGAPQRAPADGRELQKEWGDKLAEASVKPGEQLELKRKTELIDEPEDDLPY